MLAFLVLVLVTLPRGAELTYSQRNARRLLASGGYEVGFGHYPLMVLLHAAWLAALWWYGWGKPLTWSFIVIYLILQMLRGWVLMALGSRWTSRIVILPHEKLVTDGPYSFLKHPNYAILAGEVLVLPLAFGLWWQAIVFSVLNGLLLWWRIRIEDRALEPLRAPPSVANL